MKFESQTFEFHGSHCLKSQFFDIFFLALAAVSFEQALPEGTEAFHLKIAVVHFLTSFLPQCQSSPDAEDEDDTANDDIVPQPGGNLGGTQ